MPLDQTPIIDALIQIVGEANLIQNEQDKARYLMDWRKQYNGNSMAVVKPATTAEVSAILKLADEQNIAIIPQGGNTGLCGGATPDQGEHNLVISTERMKTIREVDTSSQTITVEAGCILDHIKSAADEHGLLFPLDLGARGTCQIGGNLSTNAGGLNVIRYGNTRELTLGIEVVLMGGKVLSLLSKLKKDNTGYDLKDLFIGAEGTLGVITAATLKLFPKPIATTTGFAAMRDIDAAISLLHRCQAASGGNVIAFELMPKTIIENVRHFYPDTPLPISDIPRFSALIEIASTAEDSGTPDHEGTMPLEKNLTEVLAKAIEDGLVLDATIARNLTQRNTIWQIRELTPESEIKAGKAYKSDISIPLKHMSAFYDEAEKAATAIMPGIRIFGFGHLGDGNLHYNLSEPQEKRSDFLEYYPAFDEMMKTLVMKYEGSISAEHGIGQKKRDVFISTKDPVALEVMRSIKVALDPKHLMNPGKVV